MENFEFHNPTKIIYGKGEQHKVGERVKKYADKVLLCYGGASIKKSGLYYDVVKSLSDAGVSFTELSGIAPNPRVSLVRKGVEITRRDGIGFILAVGGGSVIDTAKAIGVGFYYDGDVWDIYEKGLKIEKTLPVAAVLTIPAAGSESSNSSVISNEERGMKRGCTNNVTFPVFSIVNPELFFTLPKNQIANGVADMMSHIFERYFTNTRHTDITDGLCEATLRAVIKNAPLVYDDPRNYDAWCEIGFGGTIAHNGLLGMGREQDWACHAMEHELSAMYDIAHGAGLAILTPAWIKYVYKVNPNMFAQFAVNVLGVSGSLRDTDAVICEGLCKLQTFYRRIGLPQTLSEVGIAEDTFETMAKRATHVAYGGLRILGGLKKLYWEDVLEIYKLAK
ncbi:NADH-dependent alcohol dehydrogenase [Clostridia bacterium]|nr:NADH-dependent alcohol dehydrogenase [Clostridia bacterium]